MPRNIAENTVHHQDGSISSVTIAVGLKFW